MITVLCAWMLTSTLFPRDAFLGVAVPTVIAFQPQISYEAAMINNDALATAISAILQLLVLTVRDGATMRRAVLLGALAGATLLAR